MKINKTYGLTPGALAVLKKHAVLTEHSIIIKATPESMKLCSYLYDQIETKLPVFLHEAKELRKFKGPHGSEELTPKKGNNLICMIR